MSKSTPVRLLLPLALLFALAQAALAQVPVDARVALSSLPDSQAVLFINARRIVNEMLPKVLPPAEYRKMLTQAGEIGLDPRGLEFVAVGVRLADPPPANNLPEFVVVIRGGFNADTMLAFGRVALGAQNMKSRQETYGSKTIEVLDLQTMSKPPEGGDGSKPPSPPPYPEVAVLALDADTLVVGVPSYVRAMVDSAGGRGGLKPSLVELAAQDPQALWSLTVETPPNFAEYLHKAGAPANTEADQMIGWIKQISLAHGMDALNYTMSAAVLTDAPEHASAFSGLVRMGLLAAQTGLNQEAAKQTPRHKDYAKTRTALNAIKSFVNRTEGNTLHLSVSAPQKVVADLVRKEFAPKPVVKSTGRIPRRGRTRRK